MWYPDPGPLIGISPNNSKKNTTISITARATHNHDKIVLNCPTMKGAVLVPQYSSANISRATNNPNRVI